MPDENMGWQCPNCKKVHAPSVTACNSKKCTKQESVEVDPRKLLLEA